ncbi:MFS transporter [Pseudolactococcus reticulitermitis]|uniref:Major facilitator superfamily (MFS) profile domain-containing protein n=1 Tax=Pseudolactococcus reticulitermitis TaxID=2025039 RepID=A0A224XFH0_9LACT|nr:MFS transporter [Lactococcus reticulitermitis]GAX48293.1 hypothetical protein RsY01_1909 [Lactococcus reticulitermitis]
MTEQTNDKISPKLIAAILATGILNFAGITVETAMNITFPILIEQFHIDISTVQWMTTLYLLVVAATVPISSFLKRRFTLKRLFIVANLCFIAGVVLDSLAPTFSILLLGRFAQGIGTGIALPLMFNIILEQVPRQKLGTMIGLGTLITAVAPTVGPTFGGVMASSLGWRYIFICLLPILLVSFVLGIMTIEQKTEPQKLKLDVISFVAIAVTLVGFIYSLSHLSSMPLMSPQVLGAFIMGAFGLGIFIYRSNRQASPLINLAVFKNVSFDGHAISSFILLGSLLGLNLVLPNYIQLVNGDSAVAAGLAVLPGTILNAVFVSFSGRIYDAIGAAKPILFGTALSMLALACFCFMSGNLTNLTISILFGIYCIGFGLTSGNVLTNGLAQLPKDLQTDGNAAIMTLQQFAGAFGTSITAIIIAFSQKSALSKAIGTQQGSRNALILFLIMAGLEFVMLYVVIKVYRQEQTVS